ncbi:MAG: zincin-like metallopeptidase domain-containing protein [Firmicutes bacterium]|nr:zincin-like metallopeptidase domain-containing protein [Bacillota bacterium]
MTHKEKIEIERQAIADKVIASIEREPLTWSSGWHRVNACPHNAKTGKVYNGTNFLILLIQSEDKGYADPRWVTFNQAKELGASVKAGEKATRIFHWNEYDIKTKTVPDWDALRKLSLDEQLRYRSENIRYSVSYHSVFNAEQVDGLAEHKLETMSSEELAKQNTLIERVLAASAAPIRHEGGRAIYDWEGDFIQLPQVESFKSMQDYYATALHEIAHSTGHKSRLNRGFEKETHADYAKEELRAELASMFMQSELGIVLDGAHFENHSAYVQSWLKAIKNNKDELFKAIKDAGDIATYIHEHYARADAAHDQEHAATVSEKENIKKESIAAVNRADATHRQKENTLWQAYSKVKVDNPDALVFYRIGDFYELYGDDAVTAAKEIDLILTSRDVGLENRVPMCGVPFHAMENYLGKLASNGYKIAVCEPSGEVKNHGAVAKEENTKKDEESELTKQEQYLKERAMWGDGFDINIRPNLSDFDDAFREAWEQAQERGENLSFSQYVQNEREDFIYSQISGELVQTHREFVSAKLTPYQQKNQDRIDAIERNTPAEMKTLPNWCVYKTFYDTQSKSRKKFILKAFDAPQGQKRASFNDPATWTDFASALKYARENGCEGLSFAMKGSGLNCIDLDGCYENGVYSNLAKAVMGDLKDTYGELSRSGNGLHYFLKDDLLENGKFKNRDRADKPSIEIFDTWGFISMTGARVNETSKLSAATPELKAFLQERVGEKAPVVKKPAYTNTAADSEVIERIRRSKKGADFDTLYNGGSMFSKSGGAPDNSRNDFAMLNILAFFTNCDASQMERIFRSSALYRPEKAQDYITRSVTNAIDTLQKRPTNFGDGAGNGKPSGAGAGAGK